MTGDDVLTPRLRLVALPPALVASLAAGDVAAAAALAPFALDERAFADDGHVLRLRDAQLRADPAQAPWLLRAAVSGDGRVVGRIGFHAPPDDDGTVEVGYAVAPAYRRQGYATEMVRGLLAWAREGGAVRCLASVRPDNTPSLRLVRRLGFVHTGEQVDEVDGLELVHTLELD